jgi:hypothetical protein
MPAAVTVVVMPAVAVAVPIHGLCSHYFFLLAEVTLRYVSSVTTLPP